MISFIFPIFSAEASEGASNQVEEIMVTARKREESLLDIPESITDFRNRYRKTEYKNSR